MTYQHQPGAPIPDGENWMPKPDTDSDVPHGLEYLTQINHILIKQKPDMLEIMSGWERCNKYVILNSSGQQIYYAFEENDFCSLQCYGNQRGFVIHIVDNFGLNFHRMRVVRDFRFCAGTCEWCAIPGSCCAHQVTVEAPPGNVIGTVNQRVSYCFPDYEINDHNGEPVLNISSPEFGTIFCGWGDKKFAVKSMDDLEVGSIHKQWSGLLQELLTDADNFGVSFPLDLSVRVKATLIGATFLIVPAHNAEDLEKYDTIYEHQSSDPLAYVYSNLIEHYARLYDHTNPKC